MCPDQQGSEQARQCRGMQAGCQVQVQAQEALQVGPQHLLPDRPPLQRGTASAASMPEPPGGGPAGLEPAAAAAAA
eukprot:CAMPEP_0202924230 /NCGR_PEP_ID=MMETSP1392-20130828/78865_1 /ASSEMBLY_ACC=CAM_ASM_000868 /TAXON_ID=225041 /ORGANISM="Chlamydomonas chlamydogama, Strain SAG 11-48b" /LENGTH=75 /DNA_ID=CAMNT_0049617949 /DNA_START=1242 /DNA_END=1467 /DNA_ORIENTATION=-